jgi:hypothetical protein
MIVSTCILIFLHRWITIKQSAALLRHPNCFEPLNQDRGMQRSNEKCLAKPAFAMLPLYDPATLLPPDVSKLLPSEPPHCRLLSKVLLARCTAAGEESSSSPSTP